MLRRKNSGEAVNILEVEDIVLNRSTFELSAPNGSFRLGNKEFQMLEMLILHAGNVISAEQFMEKIWGYDSETEITVVWTYISYLRKKLSSLSDKVQIKAIRNIGYTLVKNHD